MKWILLFLLLLINFKVWSQSNYSNGFQNGYKEGYCYSKIGCVSPVLPVTPVPRVTEDSNSYKDGYNRGFEMGYNAQKSSSDQNNSQKPRTQFKTATPENIDYMQGVNYNDLESLSKALYNLKGTAVGYLNDQNYPALIKAAKTGLSVSPYDDEFMMLIGEGYRKLGDTKKAIKYYKGAYRINGNENVLRLIHGLEDGTVE